MMCNYAAIMYVYIMQFIYLYIYIYYAIKIYIFTTKIYPLPILNCRSLQFRVQAK